MDTIKFGNKKVKMIAHRGLSGIETQNTASAFVAAGNRSYFGIETDVHITKDKKHIIIHNDDTAEMTGEKFIVEETDFDILRSLLLKDYDGNKGREDLMMPSLEEYIKICKKYEKTAVLELKNTMEKQDIESIYDEVKALGYAENTIFISFYHDNLYNLREYAPKQNIQFLCDQVKDEWIPILKEKNFDVDVYFEGVTKELVKKLHKNGIKINVWTVDKLEDAARLAKMGVDFITSNILE